MTADTEEDIGASFARMMSGAAAEAAPPGSEAPYGYTTDRETGEQRPKKTAGRPRKSPTLDELKAERAETGETPATGDTAPDSSRRRGKPASSSAKPAAETTPQFRAGVIAKGVNRLYRKAGKLVRVWDEEVGEALISITRKDLLDNGQPDEEDVTVGEAWEEIARTNVRVRRFLLKVIAGGAWGQLVMCHGPVLLALLMKDSIRSKIPLARLFEVYFGREDEDEDAPPPGPIVPGEVIREPGPAGRGNGAGPLPGGLTADDLKDLMGMADKLMGQASGGQRRAGTPRARPSGAQPAGASPPGGR